MSGHSHARTVKRVKDANAKKRGQIFSKMSRAIWVAVKQGGANPETNSKLKAVIEMARSFKMPNDNIERAIKHASGEIKGENLEEVTYEAYGPGGIAIIIEGITDNKNRSLGEIKQTLNQYGGKLVQEGAIKWMFERKGCITINIKDNEEQEEPKSREDLEMMAIEAGAEDIYHYDNNLDIYTSVGDLERVKKYLEERGVKIETAALDWKPKEMIALDEKEKTSSQKLFEALDELDSVQEVYSNLQE